MAANNPTNMQVHVPLRKVRAGWYASLDGKWAVVSDGYPAIASVDAESATGYDGFQGGEWAVVYDAQGRLREDHNQGDNLDWLPTKRQAVERVNYEARQRQIEAARQAYREAGLVPPVSGGSNDVVWNMEADVPEPVGTYVATEEDTVLYVPYPPDNQRLKHAPEDCVQLVHPRVGKPVMGMAGWGCPDNLGGDYLSDAYDTALQAVQAANTTATHMARGLPYEEAVQLAAARWGWADPQTPSCTCEWEDDGDGETGPRVSITRCDEHCPSHGRQADPKLWAEGDRFERGYVMVGVQSALRGTSLQVGPEHEDMVMQLLALAEIAVDGDRPTDDGHNLDRAIGRVADALAALHGIEVRRV
jgi:hypothetical protein